MKKYRKQEVLYSYDELLRATLGSFLSGLTIGCLIVVALFILFKLAGIL